MTALFSLGVVDFVTNIDENGCAMTYMYEYPQYIPIKLTEIVKQRFPKYELYVYGEGKSSEKLRDGKFSGIPVLFIPGNSGSYKQVRSLASVALRKAVDESEYKVHFDYFSVDFDEEYSALYGAVLQDQAQFVAHCVEKILGLYVGSSTKAKSPPSSVVLVGHSLGGVIAKSLFTDPNFNPYSVQVILTLATPHTPVLLLDKFSHDFYSKVDMFWTENRNKNLSHVTVVSIGGGLRDIQVRSGITSDNSSDINVMTTAAPSVWVSTDHRCIVWCKQLILSLNRVMFDLISPLTKQITLNKPLRKEILNYHLLHRSAGKTFSKDSLHPVSMEFDQNGYWSDILKKQFTFSKGNVTCNNYLMIKVTEDHYINHLTLDVLKMDNDNWVFGCKSTKVYKNTKMCESGDNLSDQSYIIPSKGKRKAIHLDLKEIKAKNGYSHIVIFTPVHTEDTTINIDLYNPRERRLSYTVPKWISFWKEHVVLQKTVANAVFYNLSLEGIDHPWQAYNVKVQPEYCADQSKPSFGLARFITPWANDDTQVLLGNDMTLGNFTNTVSAKLQTPRPEGLDPSVHPQVHMYLNPSCTYSITIQSSMPQIMGQIIRFYAPMLLPFMVSALIMVLAFQLRRMEGDKYCRSTILILVTSVSPINIVLPSRFGSYLTTFSQGFLPHTDLSTLQATGLDFGVLPIMLMFCSIGILSIICFFGWVCVVLFGTLANKIAVKYLAKHIGPHEVVADMAVSGLNKFPSILGAFLIAFGFATCGSLALCLGCFCYLIKLFKMYEDYLKGLFKRAVGLKKDDDPALLSGINFQFTMALLWMMSTLLNIPTLMAWIQNLPHNTTLRQDPSLIHAIILSGALSVLWQNDGKPNVSKKFYSHMAIALQGIAIIIAMYASITQYRVTFAISGVFVIITLHQLFSPEEVKTEEEVEAEVAENVIEVLETSQTPEPTRSPKVKLSVPVASSDTQDSSESEYEYSYSLNVAKKKVEKSSASRMASGHLTKSASAVTDTGFGEEGLDWEYEGDQSEEEPTGKE